VLFGRCCSILAELLLQYLMGQRSDDLESAYMSQMPYPCILDIFTQGVPSTTPELELPSSATTTQNPFDDHHGVPTDTVVDGWSCGGTTAPVSCLKSCSTWLSDPSTSAQLAAARYDVERLKSQLDAALQTASALQLPETAAAAAWHNASADAFMQLAQRLRVLGSALSTLAISSACNNPTCSNLNGPSEAGLVKGRSSTCGGCRVARYCCEPCQNQYGRRTSMCARPWQQLVQGVCNDELCMAAAGWDKGRVVWI
jgi:hypothetical protein